MQYTYFHAVNYQADDTILKRLIGAYGILFVCMKIMNVWFGSYWIEEQLALSFSSLCRGKLWTLLTYSFLHATFLHFLFNSLVLYFLGRFLLLYELTPKKLLIIFTGAILSGAVVWLCVHGKHNYLLGASAGVMGLLAYMCHSFPEKTMSVLIFFVFPLQIKARWLIYCTWWYELASCMLYEMQDTSYVANSAHLGGMLFGYLWFLGQKYFEGRRDTLPKAPVMSNYKVHIENNCEEDDQHIASIVLKKLKNQGIGSLSDEERRWLERYRKF